MGLDWLFEMGKFEIFLMFCISKHNTWYPTLSVSRKGDKNTSIDGKIYYWFSWGYVHIGIEKF